MIFENILTSIALQNFDIREVSADKAYSSLANLRVVADKQATPTIDVVAFFPVLNPEWENWQEEEQRYFNFFNCTWKVPSVTSPPTPPVRETTTRDPKSPQAGDPSPYPKKLILSSPGNKSHFDGKFSYPE